MQGKKMKTTQIEWKVATYMGDNPDGNMVVVKVAGNFVRLGILTKGQRVNCPVPAIDGKQFMSDEQLVEIASKVADDDNNE